MRLSYTVAVLEVPIVILWVRSVWDQSVKSDLNVNGRIPTDIDLNECEHFRILKATVISLLSPPSNKLPFLETVNNQALSPRWFCFKLMKRESISYYFKDILFSVFKSLIVIRVRWWPLKCVFESCLKLNQFINKRESDFLYWFEISPPSLISPPQRTLG